MHSSITGASGRIAGNLVHGIARRQDASQRGAVQRLTSSTIAHEILRDPIHIVPQVRSGNVVDVDGSLLEVIKTTHTVGRGRQLGNVQV